MTDLRPPITARQQTILTFISDYTRAQGFPPTVREIGRSVGLTSTSSVQHQLNSLEVRGYIRRGGPAVSAKRSAREMGRQRHMRALVVVGEPDHCPTCGRAA